MRRVATPEQVRYCRDNVDKLVLRRSGEFTGNKSNWVLGMVGETIVCDILEQPRPLQERKADAGSDVVINGTKVDVKVTFRSSKPLVTKHHAVVSALQENNDTQAYLFMNYNRRNGRYHLVGWISKEDFLERAQRIPKGSPLPQEGDRVFTAKCDTLAMKYKDLHRINNEQDLRGIKV